MDEKQLDQLKFISETHRTAMDVRREFEWKTVTGTVTFYVLTAAAASGGKLSLPSAGCAVELTWGIAILLAILSCSYLLAVHRRNHVNKSIAEAAENAIVDSCGIQKVKNAIANADKERTGRWSRFWSKYWSFLWQSAIIFAFAITSAYLVSTASKLPPANTAEKHAD